MYQGQKVDCGAWKGNQKVDGWTLTKLKHKECREGRENREGRKRGEKEERGKGKREEKHF